MTMETTELLEEEFEKWWERYRQTRRLPDGSYLIVDSREQYKIAFVAGQAARQVEVEKLREAAKFFADCLDPGASYYHPERGLTKYTCLDREDETPCEGCRLSARIDTSIS